MNVMFSALSQKSRPLVLRYSTTEQSSNLAHPLKCASILRQQKICLKQERVFHAESVNVGGVSFGKQMKDEFKEKRIKKRIAKTKEASEEHTARLAGWNLTVGLEIHAQLNTERKLFSSSATSIEDTPNVNVSFFDLAFPGSQPNFQAATLIPALRAAVALNCRIERESRFDRKHYFYPDQPAGYQITQYYKPFATDGHITLHEQDGIEPANRAITIGIKQVQLEQDTAKSSLQPPSTTFIDFNRVGHPLIEIITLPEIHSPQIAAACARKIQSMLQAVDAVYTGMEMGGLRTDVNVSVSPRGSTILGQRTEIKNLSSFKAVEQAIIAERDRQIEVLVNGGTVAGETRGWTLGDTVTTKLRGKEGEVDYRYMPDPDILPLLIDEPLVAHIRETLPSLPDDAASDLVNESGLTLKDAKTLVALDDGWRLDYFDVVCAQMAKILNEEPLSKERSKTVGNWVIHELGGHLSATGLPFSSSIVPADSLATILVRLHNNRITGTSAKRLLGLVFNSNNQNIDSLIETEGMAIQHLSDAEYQEMARALTCEHPQKVAQIRKGQVGKIKFFVGLMMKMGEGRVDAVKAEHALRAVMDSEKAAKDATE